MIKRYAIKLFGAADMSDESGDAEVVTIQIAPHILLEIASIASLIDIPTPIVAVCLLSKGLESAHKEAALLRRLSNRPNATALAGEPLRAHWMLALGISEATFDEGDKS